MSDSPSQPFPFEKLRQFTSREAAILSGISSLFPEPGANNESLMGVEEVIRSQLGSTFKLKYESHFTAEFSRLLASLPEHYVVLAVTLKPLPSRIYVELDPDFAFAMIDKVLGGSGDIPRKWHPLTSLEEGVLEFLIVKILSKIEEKLAKDVFSPRLDRLCRRNDEVALLAKPADTMVFLTFRVKLGDVEGYVRLVLPEPQVLEWQRLSSSSGSDHLKTYRRKRLSELGHFKTMLWGEVGRVVLTAGEASELKRGDIVLFDETVSEFDGKEISGKTILRLLEGTRGGLEATLTEKTDKAFRVRLDKVFTE